MSTGPASNSGEPPSAARVTVGDLRVRAVEIPLDRPIETARGTVGTSPVLLLDVRTQEEITGSAYLFCYTPLVLAPLARLLMDLGSLLRGAAAVPSSIAGTVKEHFSLLGLTGLVGMAVAGIDMAVWDIVGKAEGRPLSAVLGGTCETVPAYAGIRAMERRAAAHEAVTAVARGFTAVKVKVGRGSLEDDVAVIREVRAAIGNEVALMVDYNQSLTVAEALRRGHVLDNEGLAWIEEPVRATDDAGHARIARELHTPIQLGENWWGADDVADSVTAKATDYATFDVARIGGVTGWRQAATIAAQAGWPVSSHRYPEVSAALLASTATAHWLEYVDTVRPVLTHPTRVENGQVLVPSVPGLGLEWDEAAVAKFLLPRVFGADSRGSRARQMFGDRHA